MRSQVSHHAPPPLPCHRLGGARRTRAPVCTPAGRHQLDKTCTLTFGGPIDRVAFRPAVRAQGAAALPLSQAGWRPGRCRPSPVTDWVAPRELPPP